MDPDKVEEILGVTAEEAEEITTTSSDTKTSLGTLWCWSTGADEYTVLNKEPFFSRAAGSGVRQ